MCERERENPLSLFLSQGVGEEAGGYFFISFLDCQSGAPGVMAKDRRSGDGGI